MTFLRNLSKKTMAVIIAVMVVLSSIVSAMMVVSANTIDVWDGTKSSNISGAGTEADPYLIETPEQLAYIAGTAGNSFAKGYVKLANDIYLNDVSKENWKETARDWVFGDVRFSGTFDGDGHTIYGLYFSKKQTRVGLFAYTGAADASSPNAVLKNLYFSYASVNVPDNMEGVGILAGQGSGGTTFERIYIDETCEINAPEANGVAGLIARGPTSGVSGYTTIINNCAVLAKITGRQNVGALTGTFWRTSESLVAYNNFSTSSVPLFGQCTPSGDCGNNYGLASDSYNTFVLTSADLMKGKDAKSNMPALDWSIWAPTADGYPVYKTNYIWTGALSSEIEGMGTEDDPYLIENADQLAYIAGTKNNTLAKGYVKLVDDIYINDVTLPNWKETARDWVFGDVRFSGTLDGDGHTIYGLYFSKKQTRVGLFAYTGAASASSPNAVIKNVKFSNASINVPESAEGVGIVAGQGSGGTTFENIYIDETCEINAPETKGVGGLIARGPTSGVTGYTTVIKNCAVLAKITGKSLAGALTGTFWRTSETIAATGNFSASNVPMFGETTPASQCSNNYALNSDSYGTTVLASADLMKGDAAKTNMPKLDWTVWKTTEDGYPVFRGEGDEIVIEAWDGTTAENFAGGTGTEDDPYLIENAAQLYKMVTENVKAADVDASEYKYYKLISDIYINEIAAADMANPSEADFDAKGYKSWMIGAQTQGFFGELDGDGFTVYGLYTKKGGSNTTVGLIPTIVGGKVTNLDLRNVYVNTTYAAGGIVGLKYGSTHNLEVTYCSLDNAVVKCTGSVRAGGIVGGGHNSQVGTITISNCAVTNSEFTTGSSGYPRVESGILGYIGKAGNHTVSNSFIDNSAHPLSNSTNSSHFETNMGAYATYTNVYYIRRAEDDARTFLATSEVEKQFTVLTVEQMTGAAAKTNMPGLDWTVWKTVANNYPSINGKASVGIPSDQPETPTVQGDYNIVEFAGGKGTATDPYLISNADQLYTMVAKYSNAATAKGSVNAITYFKLTSDIVLNNVDANDLTNPTTATWDTKYKKWFTPESESTAFCGELDGDGHTVTGLYSKGAYAGLIPLATDGAQIYNINLKNSYTNGTHTAGGIIGYVPGHYSLKNIGVNYCSIDKVTVYANEYRAGGIVGGIGYIKNVVTNCAVTNSTITAASTTYPGRGSAFVGYAIDNNVKHEVTNCYSDEYAHPVCFATDKEGNFDRIDDKVNYSNVYTLAAKNFDADEGVTYLTAAQMKGDAAKQNLVGFDFENDWNTVANGYPVLKKNAGKWKYDTTKKGEVWSGVPSRFYAGGTGTKADPYLIETGGQMALLANDAIAGKTIGLYYKITADIILNDTTKANWTETANEWYTGKWAQAFRGYLDGGYHVVSGLYINKTKANYEGPNYYTGLFACIGKGAVIEKLGIVNANMTFTHDTADRYLGAFAGFVDQYDASTATYEEYPIIRECFADTTVYLNANSCGGFIGCATKPIRVENSFFTGTVAGTSRGLFGYSKMNKDYGVVLVKNFYAADSKYAILSNNSYDNFIYEGCYSSSAQDKDGLTRIFINRMFGDLALDYMTALDFENIWITRGDNETPGLKGFDYNAYSNVMNPEDIVVNFETNCDLLIPSTTGKAYSKIELPVPTREGYTFEGWYAYPELDVYFDYDYFPTFNTILYAKWSLNGLQQDMEQYEDSIYDYHEGYEYYRPSSADYTAEYVHNGAKAIHRLAGIDDNLDFLLFYREELEVGKNYKMVFYVTTDEAKALTDLSLVHHSWPDVYCDPVDVEKMVTLKDLADGEWVEVTYTFTAKSKWIAIRSTGKNSLFFDDFTLYKTNAAAKNAAATVTAANAKVNVATAEVSLPKTNDYTALVLGAVIAVMTMAGISVVICLKKRHSHN
ncbi:MAG: InlB B-repeat-containing protein [Clostridia bacterium]|nr:InlB B-repeat-containing protein [Clostridia bacterium]